MSATGLSKFVELLRKYREKLSDTETTWIESAKTGCKKVTYTTNNGHHTYIAEFYEHPNRIHNDAYKKEKYMATVLASFGLTIYLIKETSNGGSKIDALVNDVPMDFKMVGQGNSAIKQNYQKGMDKQHCMGIVVHLETERTYTVKAKGILREVSIEKAVESYTKSHKNGLLAIWIEDSQTFKTFDMQKIRAAHNNATHGNASAEYPPQH
mgnify:FL=1